MSTKPQVTPNHPLQITYPTRANFGQTLSEASGGSLDVVVVVTASLEPSNLEGLKTYLAESVRALRDGGLPFVQGRPDYLPELGCLP